MPNPSWVDWFAADLPKAMVYPFGGGDLVTALATFPNAEEFTTISLEPAGDIRGLAKLNRKQLKDSLDSTREHLRLLFAVSHSKTTNLRAGSRSSLPGEIAFALVAFDIFDYEPVSLRYFHLDARRPPGLLAIGRSRSSIGAGSQGRRRQPGGQRRNHFPPATKPVGAVARVPALRLQSKDSHFTANQPLALHLAAKARGGAGEGGELPFVVRFFFAYPCLPARPRGLDDFRISIGVQPSLARAAGFEQECYGLFTAPTWPIDSHTKAEFAALWQASPRRTLPFFFGYPDIDGHGHMMGDPAKGRCDRVADPGTGPGLRLEFRAEHTGGCLPPKGPFMYGDRAATIQPRREPWCTCMGITPTWTMPGFNTPWPNSLPPARPMRCSSFRKHRAAATRKCSGPCFPIC